MSPVAVAAAEQDAVVPDSQNSMAGVATAPAMPARFQKLQLTTDTLSSILHYFIQASRWQSCTPPFNPGVISAVPLVSQVCSSSQTHLLGGRQGLTCFAACLISHQHSAPLGIPLRRYAAS